MFLVIVKEPSICQPIKCALESIFNIVDWRTHFECFLWPLVQILATLFGSDNRIATRTSQIEKLKSDSSLDFMFEYDIET